MGGGLQRGEIRRKRSAKKLESGVRRKSLTQEDGDGK